MVVEMGDMLDPQVCAGDGLDVRIIDVVIESLLKKSSVCGVPLPRDPEVPGVS
jgi:hypothetical protein